MISNNTLCCHWCGVSLANASKVTYLNGNLPVCDLCLIKAKESKLEKYKPYCNPYDCSRQWEKHKSFSTKKLRDWRT